MSRKCTRTREVAYYDGGFLKKRHKIANAGMNSFFAACREVMERDQPRELPEDVNEKDESLQDTDTGNSCKVSESFEYKVIFERDSCDKATETVPTPSFVTSHWRWDRSMCFMLLMGMLISIFGWIGTYAVFRKVLWNSTQETIELRERLRKYEPEEPKS